MATSKSPNMCFDELPRVKSWGSMDFIQWEGSWYVPSHLKGGMAVKSCFQAQDDDVFLTSVPKTGSTWLKALIPSIMMTRVDESDPLEHNHPNQLIPSLELQFYKDYNSSNPDPISNMTRPRLFRTHLPYSSLPESITNGRCKMVYIAREPKDTFVSLWHFVNTRRDPQDPCPIAEAFDSFCRGVHSFGPFHDHVMEFWRESLKRPEKILFMRYEEMKRDPRGEIKKLASFLGKPFVDDEEVDKVLWRCSLERLKALEVNKDGMEPWSEMPKSAYFRRGVVGDWKNSLSDAMKDRLDEITRNKFEGSGLDL